MIKDIAIQNYKLFKSFSVKDLPRILLIGGQNNCGKTSFLEAIFFIFDSNNAGMFTNHLKWRKFLSTVIPVDPRLLLEPSFYNFKLDEPIAFRYTLCPSDKTALERKRSYKFLPFRQNIYKYENGKNTPQNQVAQTNQAPYGSIEISDQLSDNKAFLNFREQGIFFEIKKEEELKFSQYNQEIPVSIIHSPSHIPDAPHIYGQLDEVNNTELILKALQIIESKLRSLSVIPIGDRPTIYGDIEIGKKIPLSFMGQGINHLLSILLKIAQVKDGIVLIDEIENGFHHSILPRIWKTIASYAKTNNTQIIATTHSREMIAGAVEGIPENMRDDFRYMRIDREGDKFDPKIYDAEMLESASKMNLAIR